MKIKFLIFNLFTLAIIVGLFEFTSYVIIKSKLGDFDLSVQGNTTMVESRYQVWQHPENYTSWSGLTHFNNLGFRRFTDISPAKPENTKRIFIMGGSAAFGSQAMPGSEFLKISGQGEYASDLTIDAHLEKILNERFPDQSFEVINAATNWTRLHQQSLHYLRKLRNLEPDLIISMDGYNDANPITMDTWTNTEYLLDHRLLSNFKHKMRVLFRNSYTAYLAAMIIFRSGESIEPDQALIQQYQKIAQPTDRASQILQKRIQYKEPLKNAVSEYMASLQYFHAVLEADKTKHLFFLQPMTIMDQTKSMTEKEQAILGFMNSRFEHQAFKILFFQEVLKQGKVLSKNSNLIFDDMLNIFQDADQDVYTDYCHFSPYGNEKIAEFFLAQIEKNHPQLLRP